jgi:hypothetical protein
MADGVRRYADDGEEFALPIVAHVVSASAGDEFSAAARSQEL